MLSSQPLIANQKQKRVKGVWMSHGSSQILKVAHYKEKWKELVILKVFDALMY